MGFLSLCQPDGPFPSLSQHPLPSRAPGRWLEHPHSLKVRHCHEHSGRAGQRVLVTYFSGRDSQSRG